MAERKAGQRAPTSDLPTSETQHSQKPPQAPTGSHWPQVILPDEGDGVIGVCVSGGPDSLTMMHALADRLPANALHVLTVDHGTRPETAAEAAFVCEQATARGLRAVILHSDGGSPPPRTQTEARALRFDLLLKAARSQQIKILCLGHTASDFAETFLMRLGKGAGLRGLANAGVTNARAKENVVLYRPLANWSRADVERYIEAHHLHPVRDPANEDRRHWRTRMRQTLNDPAVGLDISEQAINLTINRLQEADDALDVMAAQTFNRCVDASPLGYAIIDRKQLVDIPTAVTRRLLAATLTYVAAGHSPSHDRALGSDLDTLLVNLSDGAGRCTLRSCLCTTDAAAMTITREPFRKPPTPVDCAPGTRILFDKRFQIALDRSARLTIEPAAHNTVRTTLDNRPDLGHLPREALLSLPQAVAAGKEPELLLPEAQSAANRVEIVFLGHPPVPISTSERNQPTEC